MKRHLVITTDAMDRKTRHPERGRTVVMERETGVRALRSLFESLLLDLRYELPSKRETSQFVIGKEFVLERLRGGRQDGSKAKRETA